LDLYDIFKFLDPSLAQLWSAWSTTRHENLGIVLGLIVVYWLSTLELFSILGSTMRSDHRRDEEVCPGRWLSKQPCLLYSRNGQHR